MRTSRTRLVVTLALGLVIPALAVSTAQLDLAQQVETARRWAWHLGPLAPGAYAGLSALATLVGVPATPLAIVAALLFGPIQGVAVVVATSMTSAVLGFLIARRLAVRRPGIRWRGSDVVASVGRLVETNQAAAILLIRAIPVLPFAVANYALGFTRIPFRRYVVWSTLAIVPADTAVVLWSDGLYAAVMTGRHAWILAMTAAVLLAVGAAVLVARRAAAAGSAGHRIGVRWVARPGRALPGRLAPS